MKKYLKQFIDENPAKEYAKKVGGCVKRSSYVTGSRTYGMPVAVDVYYVYPKNKCKRR
jgi:hypothetical protein